MFGIFARAMAAVRFPSIEEQERAYLEQAFDRVDLEYRERQIDRGLFRRQGLVPFTLPVMR